MDSQPDSSVKELPNGGFDVADTAEPKADVDPSSAADNIEAMSGEPPPPSRGEIPGNVLVLQQES